MVFFWLFTFCLPFSRCFFVLILIACCSLLFLFRSDCLHVLIFSPIPFLHSSVWFVWNAHVSSFLFQSKRQWKKNRNFSLVPIIFDSCTFRHFISVVPLLSTFAFLLIFSTNSQQFLVFFSRLFRFGCYSLWCVCGSLIKFFCTSPPPVLCSLFVIVDCRKAQSLMRTNSNVCVKQSYSMWFWKCICSRNRAQENFFPILVSLLPLSHRNSHPSHHHTFFRIYVDIMSFFSVNCY